MTHGQAEVQGRNGVSSTSVTLAGHLMYIDGGWPFWDNRVLITACCDLNLYVTKGHAKGLNSVGQCYHEEAETSGRGISLEETGDYGHIFGRCI